MLSDILAKTKRAARKLAMRPKTSRQHLPFNLDWMTRFLPHYITSTPSQFHLDLLDDLTPLHTTRGQKRAYRGPRGSAKTTYLSKGYPLYCAVEGIEALTLLLAETGPQANSYLEAIRHELESNQALAQAYPNAVGVGSVWKSDRLTLRNGCTIVARGSGGRILGITSGQNRPTLVIGDDMNQRADAYSPTMRTRRLNWFMRDVMNVGSPHTNFLVAGTSIHREAIVCELSRSGLWQTRRYKSLMQWPDNMRLWDEWERILMALGDSDREAKALHYYAANRLEMDAGASVLWGTREPLAELMKVRATIGPHAFLTEKQDEEGVEGATEWPAEYFDMIEMFAEWPKELLVKVQSLDPSKGANDSTADYQAHACVGLGRDGCFYVDCDLRREPNYVERSLDIADAFMPAVLVAESNSTMGLLTPEFDRQLRERAEAGKLQPLRYEEMHHSDPKAMRIRVVGGYLSRGQIKVRNTAGGRMLIQQWRDWPNGDHDDGPDGVATAIRRIHMIVNEGR